MRIRRAISSDAASLAQVQVDSWRAAYRGLVPDSYLAKLDYERQSEFFGKLLSLHSEDMFVVERGNKIIGFMGLGGSRDLHEDQHQIGEIYAIYLHPRYWRKGIGRLLCREGLEFLNSQGYASVVLWVLEANRHARGFYEAAGFSADGSSKILNLGFPLTAVRYRKVLGNPESTAPAVGQGRKPCL